MNLKCYIEFIISWVYFICYLW